MVRFKYLIRPPSDVAPLKRESGEAGEGVGGGMAVLQGGYASDDLGIVLQAMALTDLELGMYGVAGCVMPRLDFEPPAVQMGPTPNPNTQTLNP